MILESTFILGPEGHCTIAVSKELCVLHVDGVWTSTRVTGVKLMWTRGRGFENPDFLVDVITG